MDNRSSNRPSWVIKIEAALDRIATAAAVVDAGWREVAETIIIQMKWESLTQARVAELLGHKPPWVSRVVGWYKDGCASGGPFAGEAAARRAKVSSTKHPEEPWLSDCETGEVVIDGSQEPDTAALLKAERLCGQTAAALGMISRETLSRAFETSTTRRREALEGFDQRLRDIISTANDLLKEVEAALDNVRPPPEFDDSIVPQEAEHEPPADVF